MARRAAPIAAHALLGLSLLTLLLGGSVAPVAAAEPPGMEYFHTYAETEAVINNVVAAHPNIAQKFSIGQSYEGRPIWAIKLTQNVSGPTGNKPEVMINALMHARERASAELAIYMLQVLGNNYGLGGTLGNKVTSILNSTVVYIIPMMNPDGAEYDFSGGQVHRWRKNRQPTPSAPYIGTDLNRQFSYTWNCCPTGSSGKASSPNYRGTGAFSAPEARAYRDFVNGRVVNGKSKITEILSLHSAAKQVLWPYSYTKTDVPGDMTSDDHAAFVALGKGIASRNGYKPQQGSDLYIVAGDQDDWAYGVHGIFAITIELPKGASMRYYPTQAEINRFNSQNLNGVLWYLQQAGCPYSAAGLSSRHCGTSTTQQGYSQSVYNANAMTPQQTTCWCAVASTAAMIESINASASVTQTDVNNFMTPRDKNDWTDPSFSGYMRCSSGSPSPSYAHDSRGMAWALWNFASADSSIGFNDYASPTQWQMNWAIVRGIRATGQPAGVIVANGRHAMLAVGYQTALDPLGENGQQNQLMGFRAWDPWYNAGFGSFAGWPSGGIAPNSYIVISDWNTKYFTKDSNEGPYYAGKYVAVLQSSTAEPPTDTPAQDFGNWKYSGTAGAGATPTPAPTATPAPTDSPLPGTALPTSLQTAAAPTIAQALADGLTTHRLLGDRELGNLPANYTLGTTVHVKSLAVGIPSYDLVELRVNGAVQAIALVNEVGGGFAFGELRPTTADVRLPTATQLSSALTASGLHGTATLSWAWTDEPAGPFMPFLTGTDAAGHTAYVAPGGSTVEQLDFVKGVTPVTN